MKWCRILLLAWCAGLLAGCQSLVPQWLWSSGEPAAGEDRRRTLADLQPATLPEADGKPQAPDLAQVIHSYERLLPLLEDPEQEIRVRHRLADLRFRQGENRLAEAAVDELDGAIGAYEALLDARPDRPENDQILYQLAKARDLRGETPKSLAALDRLVSEHPDSPVWVEAQFRRGEILFSNYRYEAALAAFQAVIERAGDSPAQQAFRVNAHYMAGWSHFKKNRFERALISYTRVLDQLLAEGQAVDSVDRQFRTLVEDLFRVMGLSFSYLAGPASVDVLFQRIGARPYEALVYDRYAGLLRKREQYSEAIAVYERFLAGHPLSPMAPFYHMEIIAILEQARFHGQIPARKAAFVADYGLDSRYWEQADSRTREYIRSQLLALLPELANRHYARARGLTGPGPGEASPATTREDFRQAARYYAAFAEAFPNHPRTPEQLFLLAESRLALEEWDAAIQAFERLAYDYNSSERAPEAGYAALLAYQDWREDLAAREASRASRQKVARAHQQSRLLFVNVWPGDERAAPVLYQAIGYEAEQGNHRQVIRLADRLLERKVLPGDLRRETLLLRAHSLYALEDYRAAESAYKLALAHLEPNDKRRAGLRENLAASVYRQGEAALDAGDRQAAVVQFLRVGEVAPDTSLAPRAHYDASHHLVQMGLWQQAIEAIQAFRAAYPNHELITELPARMALAYRETGQWRLAAGELETLAAQAKDPEEKRQNIRMAAELYDRAGDREQAIVTWRRYANRYPRPLPEYMEAANRLGELYEMTDQPLKRRFWLARQMEAVDDNPEAADDRMRYLAAQAATVLARDATNRYRSIDLKLPLDQTLPRKTDAMEKAINAWQKVVDYGVASFSTEAGYQMAELYRRLARDLMESDRPEGLSELERMQYDLLLEEQAFPFEENAIAIHEQNVRRSWEGFYDAYVRRSFEALKKLLPARYNKQPWTAEVVDELD